MRRTEIGAILAYFLPKFGCYGNYFGSLEIFDSMFEFADPEKPAIQAKIVLISYREI